MSVKITDQRSHVKASDDRDQANVPEARRALSILDAITTFVSWLGKLDDSSHGRYCRAQQIGGAG